MKSKIYFSHSPKFYVNEEKGVIVCKQNAIINPSIHFTDRNNNYIFVSAKARCKEGEKFDLNRGMRIAKTRAENMIYDEVQKRLFAHLKECETNLDEMKKFVASTFEITAHNNDYIDQLSFEVRNDYIKNPKPVKNSNYEITKSKEKKNK
jgi:hypothetical protein